MFFCEYDSIVKYFIGKIDNRYFIDIFRIFFFFTDNDNNTPHRYGATTSSLRARFLFFFFCMFFCSFFVFNFSNYKRRPLQC